jgi:hypothetical protein
VTEDNQEYSKLPKFSRNSYLPVNINNPQVGYCVFYDNEEVSLLTVSIDAGVNNAFFRTFQTILSYTDVKTTIVYIHCGSFNCRHCMEILANWA